MVASSQTIIEEEAPTEELPPAQQSGQIVPYVAPQQLFANVNWALEDLALSDYGGMLPRGFTIDSYVSDAPNQLRIGPKSKGYIYTKRRGPHMADLRPSYVCCKAADGWDAPAGAVLHLVPVRMRR